MSSYTPPGPPCIRLALALLLLAPAALFAQGLSDVELHGFGGWAYGKTDGNLYLIGNEEGNYENVDFGLNLKAPVHDRVTIVAQVFFTLEDKVDEEDEGTDVRLDYTFAEIFFDELAKLRLGRVKQPFGIYTEVFDIGTLRPFYTLPQSIYGLQGFVNTAYNGVGVTGKRGGGAEGWGFQYDLYGGQLESDLQFPGVLSPTPEQDFLKPRINAKVKVKDMVGARLNLLTPMEGLLVGISAYNGDGEVVTGFPETTVLDQLVLGAHVDFTGDRLWVRAEWGEFDRDDINYDGYYGEVAYKITPHWQLAARFEDFDAGIPGVDVSNFPDFFTQVLEFEELSFGVNYWFNANYVLRLSYHRADGNRFAFPESPDEILRSVLENNLEDRTDLVVVGMQFSF